MSPRQKSPKGKHIGPYIPDSAFSGNVKNIKLVDDDRFEPSIPDSPLSGSAKNVKSLDDDDDDDGPPVPDMTLSGTDSPVGPGNDHNGSPMVSPSGPCRNTRSSKKAGRTRAS